MNEYELQIHGTTRRLQWYAVSSKVAVDEAKQAGHNVVSVRLVKEDTKQVCPGVVCRCAEAALFCPAHGIKIC